MTPCEKEQAVNDKGWRYRIRLDRIVVWCLGSALAILWIAPVVWMVSTSLKPLGQIETLNVEWLPREFSGESYRRVFEQPALRWFLNSTIVSVITTFGNVFLGATTGYALARLHFPGRDALFALLLAILMVPSEIAIIPLFLGALKLNLANSYAGLILPSLASVFSAYLFRQFYLSFPQDLEDAARIDGCTHLGIFWWIALPLAQPAVIAATILMFTSNWNAFLWPLLITFNREMKTLPVGMAYFSPAIGQATARQFNYGIGMAAMTIMAAPTVLLFLLLQKYFVEGVRTVGIKG